jgi:all-trans-nonaprenyl-diphosphate synthase
LGHCSTSAPSHSGFNARTHQSIVVRAQALGSRDGDEAETKSVQRGSAAGPLRVFTPLREASAALASTLQGMATTSGLLSDPNKVNLKDIRRPVDRDMEICRENLVDVVGRRHPLLRAAADQIFSAGGKRIRPLIVLLVARATYPVTGLADINDRHRRLAEITEMIHTASLVHDDVLDECDIRRGKKPVKIEYSSLI